MGLTQHYSIYTDESHNPNGIPKDSFGAILGSPRRCEILACEIKNLRAEFNYYGELKWTKLNKKNCDLYEKFAQIFFNDKYAKFRIMQCTYNYNYRFWETGKRKFAKTYWLFLSMITSGFSEYSIYSDEITDISKSLWNSMSYLISRKRQDYRKGRNIRFIKPCKSEDYDLIQLTDFLLGAYCSNSAKNSAKCNMQQYVRNQLDTSIGTKKFELFSVDIPNKE